MQEERGIHTTLDLVGQIDRILSASSIEQAWGHFRRRLGTLGFPHLFYFSHRLTCAAGEYVIDDSLELSGLPPALWAHIVARKMQFHLPMMRWIVGNNGVESWDWLDQRRKIGRVCPADLRVLELFERHGLSAGFAISLADRMPRIRGGVLLVGHAGQAQAHLDLLWRHVGAEAEMLSRVLHRCLVTLPYRNPDQVLTPRQREVLEMTGIGLTSTEIAERLMLTPPTVEKHLRLARQALGARTTTQAVLAATNRRLIFTGPEACCGQEVEGQDECCAPPDAAPSGPYPLDGPGGLIASLFDS